MTNHISLPRLLFPSNFNTKHHHVLPLLLLTLSPLPLALSQNGIALSAHPLINHYPSMAVIMVVLLTSCLLTGFVSVYVHCANRHGRRHSSPSVVPFTFSRRSPGISGRGLDPSLIESFPTFLYSSVKGHKINKAVLLECAVCLNEFENEETLRLIPKCCHAFHPECIGSWLSSHATCPVCRADLTLKAGEAIIHIPIVGNRWAEDPMSTEVESFRVSTVDQEARVEPRRSRSTGHRMRLGRVFNYLLRSRSMGHSLVRPGEECERFTMRLPEEVMRNHAMMRRTKSCVAFPRESSHRSGYKTVSNRWKLAVFSGRFSSGRSRRGAEWDEESGETSSDRLRPRPKKGTDNGKG